MTTRTMPELREAVADALEKSTDPAAIQDAVSAVIAAKTVDDATDDLARIASAVANEMATGATVAEIRVAVDQAIGASFRRLR